MPPKVLVIVGPSCSGKTSLQRELVDSGLAHRVVTHTTRPPRPNETHGVDYFFETQESFARLDLIESTDYNSHWYGSSLAGFAPGSEWSVVVVDTAGSDAYRQAAHQFDAIRFVFVTASNQTLEQRVQTERPSQEIDARCSDIATAKIHLSERSWDAVLCTDHDEDHRIQILHRVLA